VPGAAQERYQARRHVAVQQKTGHDDLQRGEERAIPCYAGVNGDTVLAVIAHSRIHGFNRERVEVGYRRDVLVLELQLANDRPHRDMARQHQGFGRVVLA
jgi:hypothetical protein